MAPLPLQEGGIPLWIAGGGEKVTLRIAAKYANYTNFDGTPESFAHKSQILREHCADVGTDFEKIVRTADYNIAIGATEAEVADRLEWVRSRTAAMVGEERAEASMGAFRGLPGVGTPEQIVEKLPRCANSGWSTRSATSPRPPTTARASSCSSAK